MRIRRLPSFIGTCAIPIALALAPVGAQTAVRPQALAGPPQYEVTDLGALGADSNYTWSLNSLGQVAGYSRLFDGHGKYHYEGFFHDGVTIDYAGTHGAPGSDLLGTNDIGEAVGKLWGDKGRMLNRGDLIQAIHHGAVKRIRPKVMTITVIIAGLLPIMWSHGAGADVMKRIAAPMVGGVVTSGIMELMVYPVIYYLWRGRKLNPSLEPTALEDPIED